MSKNKGLGRGLDTLFSTDDKESFDLTSTKDIVKAIDGAVVELKIIDVEPNHEQPRRNFNKEKLEALAESIKNRGVLQPILVRDNQNGTYTIIAGERRWRASKLAGLKKIPAIIKNYSKVDEFEIALIENLQREDLNPIEEAEGYKRLISTFGLTQEEISDKVGKSRSAVANSLRLNNLVDDVKQMVIDGVLSQGHAKTILGIKEENLQLEVAKHIVEEGLNVRQTEALVASLGKTKPRKKRQPTARHSGYLLEVEKKLSERFGTKVKIIQGAKKSKIEFEYYSDEDLERLLFEIQK